MTVKVFIPSSELVKPTGTQTNEESVEIETQSVTVKPKTSSCLT